MAYRVLMVEDDQIIALTIRHRLEKEGFEVIHCPDAESACNQDPGAFDVLLLDIMLPQSSGYEVGARFRSRYNCPIIFMSCLDDKESVIKALEMGGDDYLTKPFDADVLIARIKANLRRADYYNKDTHISTRYCAGDLVLDTQSRSVALAGEQKALTEIEFQILLFLMRNPRRFFSAEEIYLDIWGKDSYGDTATVAVHIHNIRRKIERDPSNPVFLVRERGRGYAFSQDVATSSRSE